MNVKHSAKSVEQYTPPEVVEAYRTLMGDIDFDPFSCAEANKVVKARSFAHKDGLDINWRGPDDEQARVFCNPPGGKLDPHTYQPIEAGPGLSASAVAWWKLLDEVEEGNVDQAGFVCFNLNVFQNAQQRGYRAPYMFPFCVPDKRLKFWNESTPIGTGAPTQPSALIFVPPKGDTRAAYACLEFERVFSKLGQVRL